MFRIRRDPTWGRTHVIQGATLCSTYQQYDDHIASNCPQTDNPVGFHCGQNHPFDSNCRNSICCANCKQEHIAGNPSCPMKIEARRKPIAKPAELESTKPNVPSNLSHHLQVGPTHITRLRQPNYFINQQVNSLMLLNRTSFRSRTSPTSC
ncbi:unnamed protein product [Adineta ricciae]|uniref:Uncharacterized protein n=1 Tax=Adineta ricciae TaxID=249248 RepID=A0A815WGP1_ADIRI|nr:unnamed protein product [Adineta ricciae]CAF1543786.1 unnamed protein product [Adineta ricciae]